MSSKSKSEGEATIRTFDFGSSKSPTMKMLVKPISEVQEEATRNRTLLEDTKPTWLKQWDSSRSSKAAESDLAPATEVDQADVDPKRAKKAR